MEKVMENKIFKELNEKKIDIRETLFTNNDITEGKDIPGEEVSKSELYDFMKDVMFKVGGSTSDIENLYSVWKSHSDNDDMTSIVYEAVTNASGNVKLAIDSVKHSIKEIKASKEKDRQDEIEMKIKQEEERSAQEAAQKENEYVEQNQ